MESQEESRMDFEDLLTGKRRGKHGYSHDRHDDDGDRSRRDEHDAFRSRHKHDFDLSRILSRVRSLPHFKVILAMAILSVVVILVLGVILVVTLFSFFTGAVDSVSRSGLSGVVDYILPKEANQGIVKQVLTFLQGLWKGNG